MNVFFCLCASFPFDTEGGTWSLIVLFPDQLDEAFYFLTLYSRHIIFFKLTKAFGVITVHKQNIHMNKFNDIFFFLYNSFFFLNKQI